MWDEQTIKKILEQVRSGHFGPEEAFHHITQAAREVSTRFLDEATVDLDRARRCGYSEVVYAEGKSTDTLLEIFQALIDHEQDALATRVSPSQAEALTDRFPMSIYHPQGRTVRFNRQESQRKANVAVIAAGTTDLPVAWEAVETLRWMHIPTDLITDVGVAGPQRLPGQLDRFRDADAIVVVAGMEGALPSVVGGYVKCPIVAVPTSVGYGANFHGMAALLGMMNSCASNVTVVNIDGGFKGGYVAGMIAGRMADLREEHK
ncbi:MAG TPA: nickel pincer cofactor biosynthesis protein LarB [Planctomycetaceae bacterium]|nr:nickel pincer cofactor biosynthesis protein LarB [Planctomycetaceae bacterium]